MATATPSTLTTDQIDDLLYLARVGDTTDLKTATDLFAKNLSTTPTTILAAAVDKDSGNGLLHMAAANGHTGIYFRHIMHPQHWRRVRRCTVWILTYRFGSYPNRSPLIQPKRPLS